MARIHNHDWKLRCPICNARMWFSGANEHRKCSHANVEYREFELMIIQGIKAGRIKPKEFRAPPRHLVSSTQKMNVAKEKLRRGNSKTLSGGKVSPR